MMHPGESPQTTSIVAGAAARAVLGRILPPGPVRATLLRAMALGIRTANTANPGSWVLTLPKGERILNLNVGKILVLRIQGKRTYVALPVELAQEYPRAATSASSIAWEGVFHSLPGFAYVGGSHVSVAQEWEHLEQAFLEAVQAAARQMTASPYATYHSPDALAFLAHETGEALPPRGGPQLQDELAALLEALARRLLKLMARDDEVGAGLRSHAEDHARRVAAWQKAASGPFVGHAAFLDLMKDTDWYPAAKAGFNPAVVGSDSAAKQLLDHLVEVAKSPLATVEAVVAADAGLPNSCGLGFLTEVLSYLRPDSFWEMNAPTEQAVALLRSPFVDAQAMQSSHKAQHYLALRPLMEQLRAALELAGRDGATFVDVDLLLWELARAPQLFPERPMAIDEKALSHLLEDLRARAGIDSADWS